MLGTYYQLSDYISQVRTLIHDPSQSDYTDAQLAPLINNARFRVAIDLRCVRQFIAGLNTISMQESYPLTGFVGGLNIVNGGSNYTNPIVTIAGGNGVGATGTLAATNGVITNAVMTNWGSGYISGDGIPAITATVSDPTGTGAAIQPIPGLNILDVYTMTALWTPGNAPNNQSALALTFDWLPFGAFQAFCRAYRGTFSNPGAWTAHYGPVSPLNPTVNAQSIYMYPIPNQAYPIEWDVITTPNALINDTDVDYQVIVPWNDAVQYFAAQLAYLGLQQYNQAAIMLQLYQGRLREQPATGFARRIHNFYRSFAHRMRRIS